jgi:hypothetical protein
MVSDWFSIISSSCGVSRCILISLSFMHGSMFSKYSVSLGFSTSVSTKMSLFEITVSSTRFSIFGLEFDDFVFMIHF